MCQHYLLNKLFYDKLTIIIHKHYYEYYITSITKKPIYNKNLIKHTRIDLLILN